MGESVLVLQSIILSLTSSSTTRPQKLVARLAKQLDGITNARARASVFWLVGQYAASEAESQLGQGWEGVVVWAPDVLRKGVKGFTQEVRDHGASGLMAVVYFDQAADPDAGDQAARAFAKYFRLEAYD